MKKLAVVFDLDGTLANNLYDPGSVAEWKWDGFANACNVAKSVPITKHIWKSFKGSQRIILTARPERMRNNTHDWLVRNIDYTQEDDMLLMMPEQLKNVQEGFTTVDDIYKYQAEYKLNKLQYLEKEYNIAMFFEDNEIITEYVRQKGGIPTCLVKAP